ncbi:MAG: TSUP family transporter, partial [Hyphomicrobium sp.]
AIGVVALTVLYHSLSARRLIGTDIVHAIPLTFLAGITHFGMGNVNLEILGLLLLGSVPGIALGSRITGLVPDWFLRVVLAFVLVWAAYSLLLNE